MFRSFNSWTLSGLSIFLNSPLYSLPLNVYWVQCLIFLEIPLQPSWICINLHKSCNLCRDIRTDAYCFGPPLSSLRNVTTIRAPHNPRTVLSCRLSHVLWCMQLKEVVWGLFWLIGGGLNQTICRSCLQGSWVPYQRFPYRNIYPANFAVYWYSTSPTTSVHLTI